MVRAWLFKTQKANTSVLFQESPLKHQGKRVGMVNKSQLFLQVTKNLRELFTYSRDDAITSTPPGLDLATVGYFTLDTWANLHPAKTGNVHTLPRTGTTPLLFQHTCSLHTGSEVLVGTWVTCISSCILGFSLG